MRRSLVPSHETRASGSRAVSVLRLAAVAAAALMITGIVATVAAHGASDGVVRDPRAALYPTIPEGEVLTGNTEEGEPATGVVDADVSTRRGTLPFTGSDLALAAAAGCMLIVAGFGLRRSSRKAS